MGVRRPVLMGGAGVANFGDELIVKLWLDFYREADLGAPVVCGARIDFMRRTLGAHPAAPGFSRLADELSGAAAGEDFWTFMEAGLGAVEASGEADLIDALGTIPASVHLHGGGYLNSITPRNGFKLGFAVALARHFSCPLFATGIGFLPQQIPAGGRAGLFAEAMAAFDVFETRDRQSFAFVNGLAGGASANIVSGLDDAYLMTLLPSPRRSRMLVVSAFSNARFAGFLERLPAQFYRAFDRVAFWMCSPPDANMRDHLRRLLPGVVSVPLDLLVSIVPPMGVGDVMLTARYHPHLVAARMGASGAFVPDAHYYTIKQGSLVELGSPFVPIARFDPAAAGPGTGAVSEIVRREPELVGRKRAIAERLAAIARVRGSAAVGAT